MALFKFRKGGDASPPSPAQPETIEALRRRARHRLIGAAVLVLIGIVGFPLLFDTQPRPVAVDIPIEIPDRNKAKPLAPPPVAQSPAVPAASPASAQPKASEPAATSSPVAAAAPPKVEAPKTELSRPEPAKTEPAQARAEPAAKSTSNEADRAKALLEGKPVQSGAADAIEGRFVVQVGAFADSAKARDTRQKVEKTGLKTYTHVAETKDGKRIRVRVGPFASRAEADKAAAKIKDLQLPAAVLTL